MLQSSALPASPRSRALRERFEAACQKLHEAELEFSLLEAEPGFNALAGLQSKPSAVLASPTRVGPSCPTVVDNQLPYDEIPWPPDVTMPRVLARKCGQAALPSLPLSPASELSDSESTPHGRDSAGANSAAALPQLREDLGAAVSVAHAVVARPHSASSSTSYSRRGAQRAVGTRTAAAYAFADQSIPADACDTGQPNAVELDAALQGFFDSLTVLQSSSNTGAEASDPSPEPPLETSAVHSPRDEIKALPSGVGPLQRRLDFSTAVVVGGGDRATSTSGGRQDVARQHIPSGSSPPPARSLQIGSRRGLPTALGASSQGGRLWKSVTFAGGSTARSPVAPFSRSAATGNPPASAALLPAQLQTKGYHAFRRPPTAESLVASSASAVIGASSPGQPPVAHPRMSTPLGRWPTARAAAASEAAALRRAPAAANPWSVAPGARAARLMPGASASDPGHRRRRVTQEGPVTPAQPTLRIGVQPRTLPRSLAGLPSPTAGLAGSGFRQPAR